MGYSTEYEGRFDFPETTTLQALNIIRSMLGEDTRDHPEWNYKGYCYYIDLEFTEDGLGLQFNGNEKSNSMEDALNLILQEVRKYLPDFKLSGKMLAQGEEVGDIGILVYDYAHGKIIRTDFDLQGLITCPECNHKFQA